jgi:hypothetical protein
MRESSDYRGSSQVPYFCVIWFVVTKYYYGDQIKEGEMGTAISTNIRDDKWVQNSIREISGKHFGREDNTEICLTKIERDSAA